MRRSYAVALLGVVALAGVGVAHAIDSSADSTTTAPTTTVPAVASPYCRSDVLGGVHDPHRLQVMSPCVQVTGTVVIRAPELNVSDGDVTFNVKPDPGQTWMMNAKNVSEGGLHVEIVPADQPGCTAAKLAKLTASLTAEGARANLGTCTGANVIFPPMNARVRIVGPFVYDRWTSWNEIHPAWHVEILGANAPPPPETHSYAASLHGSAVPFHRGAPHGSGFVSFMLTDTKLCWRFSRLRRVGTPTRALLTSPAAAGFPRLSASLAPRYRPSGCTSVSTRVRSALLQRPGSVAAVLYTAKYRFGAVKGPLAPTSD